MSLEDEAKEQVPETPVNDGRPWLAMFIEPDGSIKVTGFVHDKMLAYGLLEAAKDAIRKSVDKKAQIERVNGSGGLIHFLRNGKH